jgi:hypothetical protein
VELEKLRGQGLVEQKRSGGSLVKGWRRRCAAGSSEVYGVVSPGQLAASTITSTLACHLCERALRRSMWLGSAMRRPMQSGTARRRMQKESHARGERC